MLKLSTKQQQHVFVFKLKLNYFAAKKILQKYFLQMNEIVYIQEYVALTKQIQLFWRHIRKKIPVFWIIVFYGPYIHTDTTIYWR